MPVKLVNNLPLPTLFLQVRILKALSSMFWEVRIVKELWVNSVEVRFHRVYDRNGVLGRGVREAEEWGSRAN
jgi:hypothetical protein